MAGLFGIFGTPALTPLSEHMSLVLQASLKLNDFFDAVISSHWEHAQDIHQDIYQLEAQADALKEKIRLNTPKNLLMSIERGAEERAGAHGKEEGVTDASSSRPPLRGGPRGSPPAPQLRQD